VREAAVAEHVAVWDAEREADDIDIRQHRAHRAHDPEAYGQAAAPPPAGDRGN
jgi:hypothetical protein